MKRASASAQTSSPDRGKLPSPQYPRRHYQPALAYAARRKRYTSPPALLFAHSTKSHPATIGAKEQDGEMRKLIMHCAPPPNWKTKYYNSARRMLRRLLPSRLSARLWARFARRPAIFAACAGYDEKYGVLMILDEVMCGMGRTGTLFACEMEYVAPDMICLAKGLGAGVMPIGATLCTGEIYQTIAGGSGAFRHGHTYCAHPTSCAVAGLESAIGNRQSAIGNRQIIERRFPHLPPLYHFQHHKPALANRNLLFCDSANAPMIFAAICPLRLPSCVCSCTSAFLTAANSVKVSSAFCESTLSKADNNSICFLR